VSDPHRDPVYADYLNEEQRDAVKYCAENGHQWLERPGPACMVEYCACCGVSRNDVLIEAGGYKLDPLRDAILRAHALTDVLQVQSAEEKLRRIAALLDKVIDSDKVMSELLGREADHG